MVQLVVHRETGWYRWWYTEGGVVQLVVHRGRDGTAGGTGTSSGAPGSKCGYTKKIQADLGYGGIRRHRAGYTTQAEMDGGRWINRGTGTSGERTQCGLDKIT